ncbi:PREDICTED: protein fantom-like isoform X6 [Wasmannia auropunctata]|uniref:protein fantom-like isoform X6 n=1 Tax=Wasmannia auropunctata TaxID=64793 RepID=UPI0005F0348E|nr:PREDICTED: protein fantom-like isoform X6 [Wasmannia auropunctata]
MADDPNRDILPVKEGSGADTIISAIDLRERHLVCKLDRYQLEDKYLRLLDEASNLKKLSNCQEDKIKRLGTKLIRLAGNPRSCGIALDIADDRNRIAVLELENTKLKEKIVVMRNQLLSHTMSGRSSSRSRNLVRPSSSGLVTCRSENNRVRAPSCQCIVGAGDDDNDMQNYLVKIEKLETQKKDMACRITELEKELVHVTNNQKEKVAENVEYIRVWRQMKQLNDKLMTTQEKNSLLTTEINNLKITLEQTTRNNQEIAAVLSSERTRIAEIDGQMLKAKTSQFTLREKDDQIRDLMSEIKILQQHNNELIVLTSKNGQIEMENIELKKRLSDDAQQQQTLKTAFHKEQVDIEALKATNEQLLTKFQELQTNIDTLTVQLTSLHTQDRKHEQYACMEQCKKCCEMYDKFMQLEKTAGIPREDWQSADKSVQTVNTGTKEQGTMIISNNEDKTLVQSPSKEWKTNQEANGTSVLSREKILKLLDQAQINTPLDASRITPKEEYASILDVAQRHSDGEMSSQGDTSNSVKEISQKRLAHLENSNTMKLPTTVYPMECFPLLITDRQGLLEIHISRLQLCTSVTKIPNEDDICNLHIYVSWDIWDEKTAYTPRLKCPNLIFNSSSVYRIADLFFFFKNVLLDYLIFRVNIVRRDGTSYTVARAKVSIKDILDYPQNKLHYIVPVNSVIACSFGVNYGQLSLWVRLSCNVDMVEAFKKQCGITSLKDVSPIKKNMFQESFPYRRPTRQVTDEESFKEQQKNDNSVPEDSMYQDTQSPSESKSDFQYENDNSDEENNYSNSNNKELSSPVKMNKMSEEESGTIRARNLDYKAGNSKARNEHNTSRDSPSVTEFKTLLTNGISLLKGSSSTIRDLSEVLLDKNWERYKQRSLLTFASTLIAGAKSLNVEPQDYRNDIFTYRHDNDAIIIEIVSMQLLDESYVMQDDEIKLLYVEYSFLGNHGEDMETISVKKPKTGAQEIVYNYKKKFWINEVTHPVQREKLRVMLAEDISPNINFTIISEPLPIEREIKDCEEIGYATFNLKKYALGSESKYILLPIKDNQNRQIGTLKISVSGMHAIRQCLPKIR